MKKSILVFALTFIVGATLALGIRTVLHKPYAEPVSSSVAQPNGSDSATVAPSAAPDGGVVNTVCAICGMDVDPDIKPAVYEGKLVGFGCAACPPKFARFADRYGPYALRNEVAPKN